MVLETNVVNIGRSTKRLQGASGGSTHQSMDTNRLETNIALAAPRERCAACFRRPAHFLLGEDVDHLCP